MNIRNLTSEEKLNYYTEYFTRHWIENTINQSAEQLTKNFPKSSVDAIGEKIRTSLSFVIVEHVVIPNHDIHPNMLCLRCWEKLTEYINKLINEDTLAFNERYILHYFLSRLRDSLQYHCSDLIENNLKTKFRLEDLSIKFKELFQEIQKQNSTSTYFQLTTDNLSITLRGTNLNIVPTFKVPLNEISILLKMIDEDKNISNYRHNHCFTDDENLIRLVQSAMKSYTKIELTMFLESEGRFVDRLHYNSQTVYAIGTSKGFIPIIGAAYDNN